VGNAELVRDSLGSTGDDAARKQKIDIIFQQAKRCGRIVANLLQFVRQQKTQFETADFNEVVKKALEFREYELNTHNVRLDEDYDPHTPQVLCDPFKIQQVVLVLLNNAIDAIHEEKERGTIWIRTRSAGDRVELEVRDDGTGIRDLDRLFDPFFTTKDLGKGTGLGLSVCYGIALEHNGEIRAENWEEGARFLLSLPVVPAGREESAAKEPAGDSLPSLSGRALIVDDEREVARLQWSILTSMGMEGEIAMNGEEAILYLTGNEVDLVVTDIRMPGSVDGMRLYRWLEEHRPDLTDRVLFISGDLTAIRQADVGDLPVPCLRKPFTAEEFIHAVRKVLGGRT
jgi:two-component system NtrC family sensor kinase